METVIGRCLCCLSPNAVYAASLLVTSSTVPRTMSFPHELLGAILRALSTDSVCELLHQEPSLAT